MTLKEKLQLQTNKKLLRSLLLAVLVILVLTSYYLGVLVGKSRSQKITTSGTKQTNSNNLIALENELRLCLSNEATISAPQDEGKYSFSTFKIYSPQFQEKQVNKTHSEYKQAVIISRAVKIDENLSVIVWMLEKSSQYLPKLPERLSKKASPLDLTYPLYDFPILVGYEYINFVTDEKFISSRIPESPNAIDTYLTRKGITTYRKNHFCPKSVCASELYFYTTTDQGKTQVFVQIIARFSDLGNKQAANRAFKTAETLADTLSLEKY